MATSQSLIYYFSGISYNDAFFNTNTTSEGAVTQSYADNQYLARVGSVTSIATNTTFIGKLDATTDATSIVSNSNVSNVGKTLATNGTTNATIYSIPFVPSNQTSYQTVYTDSGSGNHFSFQPSTNTLSIGDTTNGSISLIGTSSNMSISGSGTALTLTNGSAAISTGNLSLSGTSSTLTCSGNTTAISVPTCNIVCNGTGYVLQAPSGVINLGQPPNYSYSTLPSLSTTQQGYYTFIPATLPVSVTTQASGTITQLSGLTTILPGIYSINIQVYYTLATTLTGMISNVVAGLSTSTSSFTTPSGLGYYYVSGFNYIPANPTGGLIFQVTKVFVVVSTISTYFLSQIYYTGITPQMSAGQNYIQLVRIG